MEQKTLEGKTIILGRRELKCTYSPHLLIYNWLLTMGKNLAKHRATPEGEGLAS